MKNVRFPEAYFMFKKHTSSPSIQLEEAEGSNYSKALQQLLAKFQNENR